MKLVCIAKTVPDGVRSDTEPLVPVRDTPEARLHPDDACAIGFALDMKRRNSEIRVEIFILAEMPATALAADIARVGADRVTVISDPLYQGSDSLTEARIIGRSLDAVGYDCILAGSQTVEGGAACLPPHLAEVLEINHLSFIREIDETDFTASGAIVELRDETCARRYGVDFPAILGLSARSGYRLPYPRLKDQARDVSDKLCKLDNRDLEFAPTEVGPAAALSRVVELRAGGRKDRTTRVVEGDAAGVALVHDFLKDMGVL